MLKLRHIIPIIIAIIINFTILFFTTYRSNYEITLIGGLNEASDVVEVDKKSSNSGTYETVYVVSFSHSTLFQNFICKYLNSTTIEEISTNSRHFTDYENYKMGEIEHNSSVMNTILSAYNIVSNYDDSINLDYYLESLVVTYYYLDSDYKIGDQIIEVNDIAVKDLYSLNDIDSGWLKEDNAKLKIIRDGKIIYKYINSTNDYIYVYPYFNINYDTLNPSVNIRRGTTNGPSGGLLRSLSLIDDIIDIDLSNGLKISGTGTISSNGKVGAIGGIKQKIYTAILNDVDIFFCPSSNYKEALETYNSINNKKMELYEVNNIEDCLKVLYEKV